MKPTLFGICFLLAACARQAGRTKIGVATPATPQAPSQEWRSWRVWHWWWRCW